MKLWKVFKECLVRIFTKVGLQTSLALENKQPNEVGHDTESNVANSKKIDNNYSGNILIPTIPETNKN